MHAERCPVCKGNGLVPNGFYGQTSGQWATTNPEVCRSCYGRGFVEIHDKLNYKVPETTDGK